MVKNPSTNARNMGSILESGRSPSEGNDNPLQYSRLGNPMDRGAWWATVCGVAKESDTTEQLNNNNNNMRLVREKLDEEREGRGGGQPIM